MSSFGRKKEEKRLEQISVHAFFCKNRSKPNVLQRKKLINKTKSGFVDFSVSSVRYENAVIP